MFACNVNNESVGDLKASAGPTIYLPRSTSQWVFSFCPRTTVCGPRLIRMARGQSHAIMETTVAAPTSVTLLRCARSNRQVNEIFGLSSRFQIWSTFTVFTVAVIWIRRGCPDCGPLLGSESDTRASKRTTGCLCTVAFTCHIFLLCCGRMSVQQRH